MLVPTNNGMAAALHCRVPVAVPDAPVEFDQITEATPALAVPLNAIESAVVDTIVIAGELIVSDGGPEGVVVTGGVVTGGVVTGGVDVSCRITVIDVDAAFPVPSVTKIVMLFTPITSGTEAIDQIAAPAAGPDPP